MTLYAAYPQAVSSTEATAPACRKPCCWVNRSSCRSAISTLPGPTAVTSTPSVVIIAWRSKLARTRASIAFGSIRSPADCVTGHSRGPALPRRGATQRPDRAGGPPPEP